MLCFVEQRKPEPLPPLLPPEMSYPIWCFLIGESSLFKVKIDPTDDVADLKQKIKEEKKQALKDTDANHLTLRRVTIDASLRQGALIDELNTFPENSPECMPLDADQEFVSNYLGEIPATKRYYILARAPEGESIYYGGVLLMADVVGTPFEQH